MIGSHSPHMTPAPAAAAPQVAVVNDKQEWEICDIIGMEDVDGVPRWCPNMK